MKEENKRVKFLDVWRVCNKIRAAIFRIGLNLWNHFKPLDPEKNGLISESKFIAVLTGPLKYYIGLSEQEIADLTDYFSIQDGRIMYTQLCQVIHDSVEGFQSDNNVTGLEWEDPYQVNRISCSEHRKLNLILTQIALNISKRKIVLRPYFQDYELIGKNSGTVTITHFGRIFHYLRIILGLQEFSLLVKRFAKDAYTINYVAFLKAIDETHNYLDKHGMTHLSQDLLDQFPGRIINAVLPKLPRPEIGRVLASQAFAKQSVFHPSLQQSKQHMHLVEIVERIQRHVLERRIRLTDFFKQFDDLNVGRVTQSQFTRALDALQVSSLGHLYLAPHEIDELKFFYTDPNDPHRVLWKLFENDIDHVFTVNELEKWPTMKTNLPPDNIMRMAKVGQKDWQSVSDKLKKLCEDTLIKVRYRIQERPINLKQFFRDYDKLNHGHVSRTQLRQILTVMAVLLSQEEIFALEERYNDEMGFNYGLFIKELDASPIARPLYEKLVRERQALCGENKEKLPTPCQDERDIVLVLAKIKAKVVRERLKVDEFLRGFDPRNELVIPRNDFVRGIAQLGCNLSSTEVDTLMDAFRAPLRTGYVDYERFTKAVEEAMTIGSLDKTPLVVPIQHVPSYASPKTFLNFEERQMVLQAMEKLVPSRNSNLEEIFKDFDKENTGTVTRNQMIKALSSRKMLELLSTREIDTIYKCFSIERAGSIQLSYRAFLRALELFQNNKKMLPF